MYRPNEMAPDAASRAFDQAVRRTSSSIQLDAVARLGGRSLAYVEDYGGPSRMLNFGVLTEPCAFGRSRRVWRGRAWRAASRLWGDTPFLRSARITGTETSAEELGVAAAAFGTRDIRRWVA